MSQFSADCTAQKSLHRLHNITLTTHQQVPLNIWTADVLKLLEDAPLEYFQIHSTHAFIESSRPTDTFWEAIVSRHGSRLKRFSVQRMLISLESISIICRQCPSLEELFLVAEKQTLVKLQYNLILCPRLTCFADRLVSQPQKCSDATRCSR
jgi:hypothetical protein